MGCPAEGELLDFATGGLVDSRRAQLEVHLDTCVPCMEAVVALVTREEPVAVEGSAGRYRLGRVLGRGGMGTVYEAHDPVLDRTVAVKLLRADLPTTEHRRLRLLREAQSLARIRHRNVVAVHDAGESGREVYLAMELVEGTALDEHLATHHPAWREIVRLFIDAGRGLSAAHAVGLVHRDFKPSNVLVERQGRVVVTDFGLAAAAYEVAVGEGTTPQRSELRLPPLLAETLSATLSRIGTPAYMAPEQFDGHKATPQTDQFAFCVALVEALTGERPFRADTLEGLRIAQTHGPRAEVTSRIPGPRALVRAIVRGLAVAPADRHPSMDALIERLQAGRTARRRRAITGLTLGVTVAAGIGAWTWSQPPVDCVDPLGEVWTDARREPLRERLAGSGGPHALDTGRRAFARLGAYADELEGAFAEVCEGLPHRLEHATASQQSAWTCLRSRRSHFDALVEATVDAPAASLGSHITALDQLRAVADCLDPQLALRDAPQPEDPQLAERVRELRVALSRAVVRLVADAPRAREQLDELSSQAAALGYRPLIAEVGQQVGRAAAQAYDYEAAAIAYGAAYATAIESGHEGTAAACARGLVLTLRYQSRFDVARAWAEASAPLHRTPWEHVELALVRGTLAMAEDRMPEAEQQFELASTWRRICGACESAPASLDATMAMQYGDLLMAKDDWAGAAVQFERGRALQRERLGSGHVAVADVLVALAEVTLEAGDAAGARAYLEEALAIAAETGAVLPLGWANLGTIQADEGDHAGALRSYAQARATGPDGVFIDVVGLGEAWSLAQLGRRSEAVRRCAEVTADFTTRLGAEHQRTRSAHVTCRAVEGLDDASP